MNEVRSGNILFGRCVHFLPYAVATGGHHSETCDDPNRAIIRKVRQCIDLGGDAVVLETSSRVGIDYGVQYCTMMSGSEVY